MRRNSPLALAGLLSLGLAGVAWADLFGLGDGEPAGGAWDGVLEAVDVHLDDVARRLGQILSEGVGQAMRKDMVLRLVYQGDFYTISFDEEGTQRAASILARVHPGTQASGAPNYEASPTWRLLHSLLDDTFRAQYERIANMGRVVDGRFYVTIFLDEPSYPVDEGTELNLPGGGTDVLRAGEEFWQFTARHGTDLDAMVSANPGDLSVSAAAWYLTSGRRDVRLAEPRLAWSGGVQEFLATLLHEAAHVGDTSTCSAGNGYGPDGMHYADEVISPQGAFQEGWANYLAAVMPGKEQRFLQSAGALEVEPASGGRPYTAVSSPVLADYLANESYVGRILQGLERELGFRPLAVAFVGSNFTECRDMGHFLVTLAAGLPEQKADIQAVVHRETRGVATPAELEALVTEGFPARTSGAAAPSSSAGGEQPAEAADGAVLVEDYEDYGAYGHSE